ncbi:hypothetical protein M885DRAFT_609888 [Pelagophyceae sp. CCMP2097]|nr:hypothetical protein M885DRAFT_609888 [Pelagophyceae sp. CCMP2097]
MRWGLMLAWAAGVRCAVPQRRASTGFPPGVGARGSDAVRSYVALHAPDGAASVVSARDAQGRQLKTVYFEPGVAAVVFAEDTVELRKLAAAAPGAPPRLAGRGAAERATGFAMGALPPVAHGAAVVVDARVFDCAEALVGGGGSESARLVCRNGAALFELARKGEQIVTVVDIATTHDAAAATAAATTTDDAAGATTAAVAPRTATRRYRAPPISTVGAPIELVAEVVSKRRLSRTLCFLSLAPSKELRAASGAAEEDAALWRCAGRNVRLQLIVGKTLERNIGGEALASTIARLKVGSVIRCVAQPHWEEGWSLRGLYRKCVQLGRRRQLDVNCVSVEILAPADIAPRQDRQSRQKAQRRGTGARRAAAVGPFLQLGAAVSVIVVDSVSALETFSAREGSRPPRIFGVDAEWSPDVDGARNAVALLQLAVGDVVYIFDLVALRDSAKALDAALSAILGGGTVVGFGVGGDVARLEQRNGMTCFAASDVVDLRDLDGGRGSLGDLCFKYLGLALDKALQCSNWETARPLTRAMLDYAALDAYCLLECHARILAGGGALTVPSRGVPTGPPRRAADMFLGGTDLRGKIGTVDDAPGVNDLKDAALLYVFAETEPPAVAVDGYDRRGGLARLGDSAAIFVNWPSARPRRKYPNALRESEKGVELSWWPPPQFDAALLEGPLLFFARLDKKPFCYLGRLELAGKLDDGSGGFSLRLVDAEAVDSRCGSGLDANADRLVARAKTEAPARVPVDAAVV